MTLTEITLTLLAIILAADAFIWSRWGVEYTISAFTRKMTAKYPIIAWAVGFFMGALSIHLFFCN